MFLGVEDREKARSPYIETHVVADDLRVQWRLYGRVLEQLAVDKSIELDNMSSDEILKNHL